MFFCPHCERPQAANSLADVRPRECVKIKTFAMPAGQTVGGCCGGGQPATPSVVSVPAPTLAEKARSLAGAMFDYAMEPGFIPSAGARARLLICDDCDKREENSCTVCGCYLPVKARGKAWHCPLGKWPGDEQGWMPAVHENLLAGTYVVIPEHPESNGYQTYECLQDCKREPGVMLALVDGESGWGDACDCAMKHLSTDPTAQYVVLLNNDTRLSPNFFAGLIVAQRATNAAAVAASYNVGWIGQRTRDQYDGPAEKYQPKPHHNWVGYCDGTAVLLTTEAIRRVGTFDLSVAPKYGWGLMTDWAIRAKKLGYRIAHTEAAYVYHANMQTAQTVFGSIERYVSEARTESKAGLLKKWGEKVDELSASIELPREITTRNLIYHIWPRSDNNRWRWNAEQLFKRWHLFNGKKVIGIATGGPNTELAQTVKDFFAGRGCTFIEKENSAVYREANTFLELLDAVKTDDPREITFYAHAKGVSRPENKAEEYWAECMYETCLDDERLIDEAMTRKGCMGTHFEFDQHPEPGRVGWIFPGTFWWFHNASLFRQPNWRTLENPISNESIGWAVEAFPNRFFADDHYAVKPPLDYSGDKNIKQIYDAAWWEKQRPMFPALFKDERIAWLAEHYGLEGRSVLELGTLEGGHTSMLAKAGAEVRSVEINPRSHERAKLFQRRIGYHAELILGDFRDFLAEDDRRWDLIVAVGVLYHMENPVGLLRQIADHTDKLFLWTHYATGEGAEVREHDVANPRYLGGGPWSIWLPRAQIFDALTNLGFQSQEVCFDDPEYPNGPAFAVLATK